MTCNEFNWTKLMAKRSWNPIFLWFQLAMVAVVPQTNNVLITIVSPMQCWRNLRIWHHQGVRLNMMIWLPKLLASQVTIACWVRFLENVFHLMPWHATVLTFCSIVSSLSWWELFRIRWMCWWLLCSSGCPSENKRSCCSKGRTRWWVDLCLNVGTLINWL